MNYYPFHLGDYMAHTAHLDPLEDLAYRRMLDLYYLRECALPANVEDIAKLIRMRKNLDEIRNVLREFFVQEESGDWVQMRCEQEIERMQDKQTKARLSAAASVKARSANAQKSANERSADAQRTLNERSADVELPTPTPTPKKETPPTPLQGEVDPPGFAEFWASWPQSPRKVSRKQCAAKWRRHRFDRQQADILAHVEAMKHSAQWLGGFEPAPLTYLNGERWGDGVPEDGAPGGDALREIFARAG